MNRIRRDGPTGRSAHGSRVAFGISGIVAASLLVATVAIPHQQPRKPRQASSQYGRWPLRFEANVGQTDPRVQFLSRGQGYMVFLTNTEMVLALSRAGRLGPLVIGGDDASRRRERSVADRAVGPVAREQ